MNIVVSLLTPKRDGYENSPENNQGTEKRPSVCLAQLRDLPFDHYYIFGYPAMFVEKTDPQKNDKTKFNIMQEQIADAVKASSPNTALHWETGMPLADPWNLEEVFTAFRKWSDKIWKEIPHDADLFIHTSSGTHIEQISLFLLMESRHLPGKLIQTLPDGGYRIIDLAEEKYKQVVNRFIQEPASILEKLKDGIETRDESYNSLIQEIAYIIERSDDPILLTGPTGAGKSKLAQLIYDQKKAKGKVSGAFVALNCATLDPNLAASELFGHKKGAFSGAVADRVGFLEAADGGVLFLDEVGDLSPEIQAKLLTAIEKKSFYRVGDSKEIVNCSFQLICGTNHDLRKETSNGRFRLDLLERINMWTFRLPGLAERSDDIEPNLDKELAELKKGMTEKGRAVFLDFAKSYPWPGNFREFNKMLHRAATLSEGPYISPSAIEKEIGRISQEVSVPRHERDNKNETDDSSQIEWLTRQLLGNDYTLKMEPLEVVKLHHIIQVCLHSTSLSEAGRKLYGPSTNDAQRLSRYLKKIGVSFAEIKAMKAK